jgi:hypothetical protein
MLGADRMLLRMTHDGKENARSGVGCEMRQYLCVIFAGFAAAAAPLCAQTYRQQARIVAGNGGRCTVEVVVDGSAEVEIRGGNAILRPLSGQQPQWRRFECTGVMPMNPLDFRFQGVDGRGTQRLIREPRNGGGALVRIEDPRSGAEGYTFDVTWSDSGPFSANATRACENAVRQQAFSRFNARDVTVRLVDSVDNYGPRDTIYGTVNVSGAYGRDQTYPFSCAVNYSDGRVLSARIDSRPSGGYPEAADRPSWSNSQMMQNCQRAVEDRMRRDGYARVQFESINVDNRPGPNASIIGTARSGRDAFQFSCGMTRGSVRSVDVSRR